MENFVAIDVETAQGKRWSICQIGLAIVENGVIIETISELVQPPNNEYSVYNTRVHGIKEKDTVKSPLFPEVWQKLYPKIQGQKLVAHNASFDINCLHQTFDYYDMDILDFNCACTYKLTGKKLDVACNDFGINLTNHHDAVSDAVACAEIFLKVNGSNESENISYLAKSNSKKIENKTHRKSIQVDSKVELEISEKSFCFTGKLAELSRSQAEKEVRARGGLTIKTISANLDYLVIGSIPSAGWKHGNYGRKIEKAQELIANNSKLKLVSEDDYMIALENTLEIDSGEIDQKFVLFRYEAFLKNGTYDIDKLTKLLIRLKEEESSHLTAKFDDPLVLQNLYGLYEEMDVSDSVILKCRIVKQFPLDVEVVDFIDYVLNEFESIDITNGKYTWSEKKEGSATYARLFKEIPENIELNL